MSDNTVIYKHQVSARRVFLLATCIASQKREEKKRFEESRFDLGEKDRGKKDILYIYKTSSLDLDNR